MAFLAGIVIGFMCGLIVAGLCASASKPEPDRFFGGD